MTEEHKLLIDKIDEGFSAINKRLDNLNGSVAKHADKLANQDVLNAQTTITQQQLVQSLSEMKTTLKSHDDFIIGFKSNIATFKWLFGFVGIGNLIIFLKIILGVF